MTSMPNQVLELFATSAPFDQLQKQDLKRIIKHAEMIYLTADNCSQYVPGHIDGLYLIQSGQYKVKEGAHEQRYLSDGEYFGMTAMRASAQVPLCVEVDEAGLLVRIPLANFIDCTQTYPHIARFFQSLSQDDKTPLMTEDANSIWLHKRLEEVIQPNVIQVGQHTSIQQAAQLMTDKRVSSLLITELGKLVGIVTDRDLRGRVVAAGIDTQQSVNEIMTISPSTIGAKATLFDALSTMTEQNIHHLPIVEPDTHVPLGIVTASDMVRYQRGNLLFLLNSLSKAASLYQMVELAWQLPQYFATYASRLGDFDLAGKMLARATDIMTRKLIEFFQAQHGQSPIAFCWLVYGSQAREDQTMGSDQDNAILLATTPNEVAQAYFKSLADYVCDGLNKCGIKLCSGNIMASNPELRLSLEQAELEAKSWVNQPTKEAIMHCNIYLDVRAVAGERKLLKQLQIRRAKLFKQQMFLAALARHNNDVAVPLSMFNRFVCEKNGKGQEGIDLKKQAVAVINNLARMYALAEEVHVPATLPRLDALSDASGLVGRDRQNLKDIWLFLNRLRWRHQVNQKVTDNLVLISELSSIEKHQLKGAFQAIRRAQQAAVLKFAGGMA